MLFSNFNYQKNLGRFSILLAFILIIVSTSEMVKDVTICPLKGSSKPSYGLNISGLVFLTLGFILDFVFNGGHL